MRSSRCEHAVVKNRADQGIGKGATCKRYAIHWFPTTLVIDQDGKVAVTVDVREKGRLDAMIDDLLNKNPRS